MAKLTARQHAALVWLRTHQPKLRSEAMVFIHPMTWIGLERRGLIVESETTRGLCYVLTEAGLSEARRLCERRAA